MKKTLVALAALAATGAFAQSSVTLYGIADVGIGAITTNTSATTVAGVTTTGSSKSSMMLSGGPSGGRWGLRGSEDLGGGLKANFTLESGLNVADGSGNADFKRRSIVGLSGNFGAVDFGREYAPTLNVSGATDVDGVGNFSTTSHFNVRRSNSITYSTPNLGGFGAKFQFAKNATRVNAAGNTTTTDAADSNGMGFNLTYANGPAYIGFAYDTKKEGQISTTVPALTTAGAKTASWLLGGTYDLGAAKLFANFGKSKSNSIVTLATGDTTATQFNLGATVPFGAVTAMASIGRNKATANNGVAGAGNVSSSGTGTDFMVGADYSLSKRTTIHVRAGAVDKLNTSNTAGGLAAGSASTKRSGYYAGVRHTF